MTKTVHQKMKKRNFRLFGLYIRKVQFVHLQSKNAMARICVHLSSNAVGVLLSSFLALLNSTWVNQGIIYDPTNKPPPTNVFLKK